MWPLIFKKEHYRRPLRGKSALLLETSNWVRSGARGRHVGARSFSQRQRGRQRRGPAAECAPRPGERGFADGGAATLSCSSHLCQDARSVRKTSPSVGGACVRTRLRAGTARLGLVSFRWLPLRVPGCALSACRCMGCGEPVALVCGRQLRCLVDSTPTCLPTCCCAWDSTP